MSDHYDLFLSVELQPDLPDEVMREIRWHLRPAEEPPARFQALPDADWLLDEPVPLFSGLSPSHSSLRHDQQPAPDLMHHVDGRLEFGQPGRTNLFGAS